MTFHSAVGDNEVTVLFLSAAELGVIQNRGAK